MSPIIMIPAKNKDTSSRAVAFNPRPVVIKHQGNEVFVLSEVQGIGVARA